MPIQENSIGKADKGSRAKSDNAAKRTSEGMNSDSWPVNENGTPMFKAEMSAAELIPTGQYANVSIGPVKIHFLVGPDRRLQDGEAYFLASELNTVEKALNEMADVIERDVIAVQRNLVYEAMKEMS